MEEEIKDTELYRSKLQDDILRELCGEWLRLIGKSEIPDFAYYKKAKEWDVPEQIMARVIEEMIDEGWLEEITNGYVTLTAEGRKECKRRKFDRKFR